MTSSSGAGIRLLKTNIVKALASGNSGKIALMRGCHAGGVAKAPVNTSVAARQNSVSRHDG